VPPGDLEMAELAVMHVAALRSSINSTRRRFAGRDPLRSAQFGATTECFSSSRSSIAFRVGVVNDPFSALRVNSSSSAVRNRAAQRPRTPDQWLCRRAWADQWRSDGAAAATLCLGSRFRSGAQLLVSAQLPPRADVDIRQDDDRRSRPLSWHLLARACDRVRVARQAVVNRPLAYRFDKSQFIPFGTPEPHAYVSPAPVRSLGPPERVGPLLEAHAAAGIELRLLANPWPYWREVMRSTLGFSGIRLRNVQLD